MISPAELRVQRLNTIAFIKADPIEVTLYRSTWVDDGAGGSYPLEPLPLAPQEMRLIPLADGATPRTTANGQEVTPSYMLMGTWQANIDRWDFFEVDGREYEVVFINENRQYEVKAEVAYRGGV